MQMEQGCLGLRKGCLNHAQDLLKKVWVFYLAMAASPFKPEALILKGGKGGVKGLWFGYHILVKHNLKKA